MVGETIANHHSDDFELGNRIARRGYRVELMRKPVWMVFPKETIGKYSDTNCDGRWIEECASNSLPVADTDPRTAIGNAGGRACGCSRMGRDSGGASFGVPRIRLGLAWATGIWGLGDTEVWKKLWLVPLRDAVSFVVWVGGFFSERILWRGLVYRVKNGQLFPLPSPSLTKESASGALTANITNSENLT